MKQFSVKLNIIFKSLGYLNIFGARPQLNTGPKNCIRRYCFLPKATTLESCVVESCSVNPCNPEPRVVIVGAGMAGLSAAQRLVQCGIQNIIVLEATERPGGRIHSYWLGDVVAELGAQWIYGACLQNSVFTLASQSNVLNEPLNRLDPTRTIYCTSDGRSLVAPVTTTAYHAFRQIEQQATNIYREGCCEQFGSLHHFLSVRIHQELNNFPEYQRHDAARVMYGLSNDLRNKCGEDLYLVSADQFGSYVDMPGGSIQVPRGYVNVVEPLLRQIPLSSIRYSKPVNIIRWDNTGNGRVQVECCDGEAFSADYVIVTVSLGCLKCHGDHLFCPSLPPVKKLAVDTLGFGVCNKIYLEYDEPFWVPGEGNLKFAWTADEIRNNGLKGEWTCGVTAVNDLPESSKVLCAIVSAEQAVQMETLSEGDVVVGLTQLFRRFTGNPCIPFPVAILRSMWASDPHFCGSYSYLGCGSCVTHQHDLASSLPFSSSTPSVLFAGEATVPGHFGTAHGARVSGIREADTIVELTNKLQGPPR